MQSKTTEVHVSTYYITSHNTKVWMIAAGFGEVWGEGVALAVVEAGPATGSQGSVQTESAGSFV